MKTENEQSYKKTLVGNTYLKNFKICLKISQKKNKIIHILYMRFVAPKNIMICRIPYMNPLVLGMSHKMASFWRRSWFDFIIMSADQNVNDSLKISQNFIFSWNIFFKVWTTLNIIVFLRFQNLHLEVNYE